MVVLEIGRVCLKIAGREAGKYAVVVKAAGKAKDAKSFVFVTGPRLLTGVKRRKCNIDHLKATEYKLEISEDAQDEQVITAYEKAGLIIKLGLKKPSAAQLKAKAEKKAEKEKKKAETAKKQKKVKVDKKKEKK
jgi:large subunit ribosomal protein L14e